MTKRPKELPILTTDKFMAQRIRDNAKRVAEYEATLDPRQLRGTDEARTETNR